MCLIVVGLNQVYIVYMGDLPKGDVSVSNIHIGMLEEIVPGVASDVLLYSYRRSFNGFAAKLTQDEANKLKGKEGVVSVFPSQKKQLHTSRTWEFMGFNKKMKTSIIESDIIIGMLDTGVWPESESFNDTGFGPIPKKWKGTCQKSANFSCNNKIIGARYYLTDGENGPEDFISPRDADGHGTHTTSTAAGGLVSQASLFGIAKGTVRGGVPSARIAVYKICWSNDCSDEGILAAFDDAIADGVDIISLSVGSFIPFDYFEDSIAIGAFHAMKKGILTSNSAGNGGPTPGSVVNVSPWSLTVAASTIDRKFVTKVKLGNGQIFEGATINTFDLKGKMYPFIYGGDAPNLTLGVTSEISRYCFPGALNATLVKGKIVFCEYFTDYEGVLEAGALGAVFQDTGNKDFQFSYPLPFSTLNVNDGRMIINYLNTTENPTATIFKTSQDNNQFAPFVVSFSSRGPNPITPDILKFLIFSIRDQPDLTAPGVDILAAWSEASTVTEDDTRRTRYNIISGTSMSCPHATGAAAYVKSFHPTWSPAAIRSALMTTAIPMTSNNNIEGEHAYGAGHINPLQATDPGLVYDAGEIDYVKFLCGQGYTIANIQLISGNSSSCSEETDGTVWDLNYPSFALSSSPGKSITRVFHRTVTNVGSAVSNYRAVVNAPPGLIIQVQPSVLSFEYIGQQQSFVVTVGAELGNSMISGSLIWDDGVHQVHFVYMGDLPKGEFSAVTLHNNMLEQVIGSGASELLLHSYRRSFNGFAAKLTNDEAEKLAETPTVFQSQRRSSTRQDRGTSSASLNILDERDIIVAVLDTGIWPESESFGDKEFGPPPKKWKGSCQKSFNFTCNNKISNITCSKIIGARYYRAKGDYPLEDLQSPRDSVGHGSHTAPIAAGAVVSKARTVRGGVPSARIAVYKICWYDGSYDEDILAAFDDAIADGVDLISLSVGVFFALEYFSDSIAIEAFHSMKNGILTSNSAGNDGPYASVVNISPWSLSVGASTIDKKFQTTVKLGNGKVFKGTSVNTFDLKGKFYPLIWGANAPKYSSLNETLVKGKIVLCDYLDFMEGPLQAGAVGALIQDDGFKDFAYTFALPVSVLGLTNGSDILHYINTTKKAEATILRSTEEKDELAPYVASFSLRGPNILSLDILKLDITAPGVDILAAWWKATTVTGVINDKRIVPYNIISGTSMSCPHATAVAAYVKSFHPTWSPSAIKSALMTTGTNTIFAIGESYTWLLINIFLCFATAWPMSPKTNTDLDFA
ncbi:cucumisin-like [Gossypium australe]|uniref:Cucumisin-like n=1 Tax=Gossypium australe TaxID=47621 RepID=A0A5B6WKM4_9ROSI|nr:cucumisin-like [Gossypium australe]